jgi:two-component system KDP operon response regulator KdpE
VSADPPKVLVIEDEEPIQRFLCASLGAHGFKLISCTEGEDGLLQTAAHQPDVVILDLGLPDLDGMEVLRRMREWSKVPVIVLSARGQERDKVAALDAGADDYLTKPFGVGELLARLRVALRHSAGAEGGAAGGVFETQGLRVDQVSRRVWVGGEEVHLTPIEYRLLTTLIRYAGRVVTHRQLLKEVWGPQCVEQSHYLRVYMGHLRHRIEKDPARPRILLTELGVGYRLAVD